MSTTVLPRPTANRPTLPPPIPVEPPRLRPADGPPAVTDAASVGSEAGSVRHEEPKLWERTLMLFGTSFGVSLLLHLCVLSMLAFWIFRAPMPEILVIDSGVYDPKKIADVDTQVVKIAPAAVPKDDVSPLKSNAAVHAVASGSPEVDFEIKVPDLPGMGTNKGGGDGKGVFGSGTAAKSYVFVVDCSASMLGQRFTLAISELIQTIGRLKSNQRFYVVFYSDATMPMFSRPSLVNAKDGPIDAARFAVHGLGAKRNRFGKRRRPRAPQRVPKRTKRPTERLLTATAANRERAKRWIFQIRPGGGTLPGEALQLALQLKPQVVYFLTDGEIPINTPDIVRDANTSKVIVNTVALGYEGSADLLKEIAGQNGGQYKFVK
jgi:von Willebrand factor type A domain